MSKVTSCNKAGDLCVMLQGSGKAGEEGIWRVIHALPASFLHSPSAAADVFGGKY